MRRRSWALLSLVLIALAAGGIVGVARVRAARAPLVFDVPAGDFQGMDEWHGVALSEDGAWLAVATRGSGVRVWPVAAGASPREIAPDEGAIDEVLFEPATDALVVRGLTDRTVRRFSWRPDVRAEAATHLLGPSAVSPAGGRAIAITDSSPRFTCDLGLWDTRAGALVGTIPGDQRDGWDDLGFSPSGALFYREQDTRRDPLTPQRGRLRVWSARDQRLVVEGPGAPGKESKVRAVLDPGEHYLLETPSAIEVREVATGRSLLSIPARWTKPDAMPIAVTWDGDLIALGEQPVEVRALGTGELIASFAAEGVAGDCEGLSFDRAGDRLAGVWNGKAFVWKVPR